jgi:hypothetical protein
MSEVGGSSGGTREVDTQQIASCGRELRDPLMFECILAFPRVKRITSEGSVVDHDAE